MINKLYALFSTALYYIPTTQIDKPDSKHSHYTYRFTVHERISFHTHTHTHIHACTVYTVCTLYILQCTLYTHTYIHTYTHSHTTHTHTHMHTNTHTHTHTPTHTFSHTHTHTHTHTDTLMNHFLQCSTGQVSF